MHEEVLVTNKQYKTSYFHIIFWTVY